MLLFGIFAIVGHFTPDVSGGLGEGVLADGSQRILPPLWSACWCS